MKTAVKGESDAPLIKNIALNRKARHLYHVLETHEAGIVLDGTEVKSLRSGQVSLVDAFGIFNRGELFLMGVHISPYEHGNRWNSEPKRSRKLLLHRRELKRLVGKVSQRGLTLVPLRLYFKGSRVKCELALCQGKKTYDKRETMKQRDQQRDMDREMRRRR